MTYNKNINYNNQSKTFRFKNNRFKNNRFKNNKKNVKYNRKDSYSSSYKKNKKKYTEANYGNYYNYPYYNYPGNDYLNNVYHPSYDNYHMVDNYHNGYFHNGYYHNYDFYQHHNTYQNPNTCLSNHSLSNTKSTDIVLDESSKDSYSRECVNTLNAHLSENKNGMICIIAGYADSLDKYFFSMNEGLKRRFPYRLKIGEYSSEQIKQIFLKKVQDSNWNCVDNSELSEFFETHRESFQYNGGDMETLVHKCKTAYSKRIINLPPMSSKDRKLILIEDVKSAYQVFMDNKKIEVEDKSKIEGFYI